MTEVHHFIFNELKVAIRHSVPIVPLLDDLIRYNLISTQERDAWKSHGKNGMRRLIAKLRGKDFDTFILFVKCILEAGRRDSSVQMTIVNSIRGAADVFDEVHKTNFKDRIPQNLYDDPELYDSDEEDDRDSGCASDASSTPTLVQGRANSLEHTGNSESTNDGDVQSSESLSPDTSSVVTVFNAGEAAAGLENEEESNSKGKFFPGSYITIMVCDLEVQYNQIEGRRYQH